MKRKIVFTLVMIVILACLCVVSVNAAEMTSYCDAKITLVDDTQTTGYFPVSSYQLQRDTIYATTDTDGETISWSDVKVLDFRGSTTMSGGSQVDNSPTRWLGTNLNGTPSNVTTVYLPETMTYLASTSFTSAWSSLDTVYIPASLAEMGGTAFAGSAVKNVVFAENSQFKTMQKEAFKEAKRLANINLEDTILESIAENAFRQCESLKSVTLPDTLVSIGVNCFFLSGVSGKMVVPNSVTDLGAGAFLSTKIETLVLGDGPVTIGFNFAGNYNATNNAYLKEVYIPSTATITSVGGTWYECVNTVTFYVVGEVGEDCSSVINQLKGSTGSGSYMNIISASEVEGYTGTYNGVIVEGYNKCDAFYNGEHNEVDDKDCTTDNLCSKCKRVETEALSDHTIESTIEYEKGFASTGIIVKMCVNEGCEAVDGEATEALAIFSAMGYSTNAEKTALCGGYSIDKTAHNTYAAITKTPLKFGIIIANADSFAKDAEMLDANGVLTTQNGLQVEMTDEYTNFACSVYNFSGTSSTDLNLVIALYVIAPNGEISYIQADVSYANPAQIGTNVFDSVTLNLVINKPVAVVNNEE